MQYTIQKSGPGYMHYIVLGPTQVSRLTKNGNKRVICCLNDTVTIHAAILRNREGFHYVMIGSSSLKQLKLAAGSKIKASFSIDNAELQFSVPEEFLEVIDTDEKAKQVFDRLTDGNKRSLIALVNAVKSADKKIERALLIARKLRQGVTKPQLILKKEL